MEPRSRPGGVLFGPALILLALSAATLLFGWSWLETRKQGAEIRSVTSDQGAALVEALGHAVENALASNREVEELSAARLLDTARLLARLDRVSPLEDADLHRIASDLSLHRIALLDSGLREVAVGGTPPGSASAESGVERRDELRVLTRGEADELVFEPTPEHGTGVVRLGAAVRRGRDGALVVSMDAREMHSFQEATGVQALIEAVAATGGVIQVVLEDDAGAEVARTQPSGMSSPAPPIVLEHPVVVAPGRTDHLKIVLSGEAIAAAGRAARRRTLAAAAIALGLTIALGAVFASRRRAERIRSVTDAILEGMDDAVVVIGTDGKIQHVNPAACRLFAQEARTLIGAPCRSTPCAALGELLASGGPREIRLDRPPAPPVLVLASASPVRDERNRLFGTAFLMRDLTETKSLEREARRSESLAAFGRLAATVAHEVRNPLNAISVGVQRLAAEFPPPTGADDQLRLVRLLRGEVERLDGIVGRFLDLAKPPGLSPVPGDLDSQLRAMLPLLSDGAPAGVRFDLDCGLTARAVFDPSALRQILLNLVRNAVEAVGAAGTVRLATFEEGGRATLEVADDGPGIAPADLDRIFEFGFTTKPAGNGLGLPIVHRLVTEMDGGIAVASTAGRGTAVRVTLPLALHPSG